MQACESNITRISQICCISKLYSLFVSALFHLISSVKIYLQIFACHSLYVFPVPCFNLIKLYNFIELNTVDYWLINKHNMFSFTALSSIYFHRINSLSLSMNTQCRHKHNNRTKGFFPIDQDVMKN